MASKTMLMKTKWYPQPHAVKYNWLHGLETGAVNNYTIVPIAFQDEGLGTPSAQETHPENAAFAVEPAANCFPDSRINIVTVELDVSLTKACLETDKLPAVRCCYMPIFTSFLNDLTTIDELSSIEIQDVIELSSESTDRQTYPNYNDVKMVEKVANSALMDQLHPNLTTTQVLEGVPFDPVIYYNALQYLTISEKLKRVQGGLNWFTLTRFRPVKKIRIFIRPKVKRMNPYTFFGVLFGVPKANDDFQYPMSGETTNVSHVSVNFTSRFNEWHQDFNFKRI